MATETPKRGPDGRFLPVEDAAAEAPSDAEKGNGVVRHTPKFIAEFYEDTDPRVNR